MKLKYCKQCKNKKSLNCFSRSFCSHDGYLEICKKCENSQKKQYTFNDTGSLKKEYRDKINHIKELRGCCKCQERDSICLEFHHIHPEDKIDTISNLIKHNFPWDIIAKEIDKCEVICSNCHKKIHKNYLDSLEF